MSGTYGRTELYLAHLPPRWQMSLGSCTQCSLLYPAELLDMLSAVAAGRPVTTPQLSQLYALFVYGALYDGSGVCTEALWPVTLCYGPNFPITDYNQSIICQQTRPSDAAYANAPHHKITEMDWFMGGDVATAIGWMKRHIDAGHGISCFEPPNHEITIWDYEGNPLNPTWIGMDSMSPNAQPCQHVYGEIYPQIAVTAISFANSPVVTPPAPTTDRKHANGTRHLGRRAAAPTDHAGAACRDRCSSGGDCGRCDRSSGPAARRDAASDAASGIVRIRNYHHQWKRNDQRRDRCVEDQRCSARAGIAQRK